MEVVRAEFITSAVESNQYPADHLPYVALVGKSNVGKSSMINTVTNRSKLAKTSGQPGKTRLVNFYRINNAFYLVDLPGYGFARVSQKEKERWGYMIETFLSSSPNLLGIIQLIDIRHNPTADDMTMLNWIEHYEMPLIILATKADKLGKTRIKPQIDKIRRKLEISLDIPIIPFSSKTGQGKEALLKALDSLLKNPPDFQGL
ncbi:MAG: ribosome biogenesis GTP-binding protein YihA/YsxC [Caldicoprobacterales bacterium]|jgi:GTP-binding protein|nr:YihA family ribosome biogenesis GTP-binding protein [Clostridiales bacterium]